MTDDPRLRALQALLRRTEAPTTATLATDERRSTEAAATPDDHRSTETAAATPLDPAVLAGLAPAGVRRYRRLVVQRLRHTIRDFLPRTAARLGSRVFRDEVVAFLEAHASRTPYLRDLPNEFVAWALPRWRARAIAAPDLVDLAHYEALELAVLNDPRGGEAPTGRALRLDAALVFDGSTRLARYDHAVHRLPRDPADRTPPQAEPTFLLAYRDAADGLQLQELSAWAHRLLGALRGGATVTAALHEVCDRRGNALDERQLAKAAELLADLAQRGVLLGAPSDAFP